MITQRDRIEASLSKILELIWRDARSASEILSIDDPHRGRESLTNRGHRCLQGAPTRLPHTITKKNNRKRVGHRYTLFGVGGDSPLGWGATSLA